jgi:hypothetical protein
LLKDIKFVIMKTYTEKRDLVSKKTRELVEKIYPKDSEMKRIIEGQIQTFGNTFLLTDEEKSVANDFVNGLLGFVQWCEKHDNVKVTDREILTTFIHDLSEFNRNRKESWFLPRSDGYKVYYKEEEEETLGVLLSQLRTKIQDSIQYDCMSQSTGKELLEIVNKISNKHYTEIVKESKK